MCAYCDVIWASNMDGCKSTSSYVFLLRNGASIHHHLVRKKIKGGFVKLMYCNVENMIANVLTKELSINEHE
jgi:hypothetical protein